MGKSRQFAKKGEEVRHFKLVARSQHDANVDDPDATPLVLEAFAKPGDSRRTGLDEEALCSIPASLQALGPEVFGLGERDEGARGSGAEDEAGGEDDGLGDLDGDCYFPKDGYDYDQHLKRVSGAGQGGVAGVVLAAPKPKKGEKDLFPDAKKIAIQMASTDEEREVMEALENADEYEDIDEDEVMGLLPSGAACDLDEVLWGPTAREYKDMPDLEAFKAEYAAMRGDLGAPGAEGDLEALLAGDGARQGGPCRPGAPAMNDADFSEFLGREYAEDEIGECEGADMDGHVNLEEHEEILDEYILGKADEQEKLISINEPIKGKHEKDDGLRTLAETRAIIEKHYLGEDEDEDGTSIGREDYLDEEGEDRTWDCESVLSFNSNLSNRPGKIATIRLAKKPCNPLKPVKEATDTAEGSEEGEEEEEDDVVELPDVNTTRPRGETAEQRRERKAGVKEMRRICRKMKKDSKDTYKEASKTHAQPGSGDLRGKLRTFRLS